MQKVNLDACRAFAALPPLQPLRMASRSCALRHRVRGLRVVSWNVDGLDDANDAARRAREICALLLVAPQPEPEPAASGVQALPRQLPDVIMLQEIVESTMPIFRSRLGAGGYECVSDSNPSAAPTGGSYFTSMFLRRRSLRLLSARRVPFPNSRMGRDLLEARCTLLAGSLAQEQPRGQQQQQQEQQEQQEQQHDVAGDAGHAGLELTFLTSHFESEKSQAQQRRAQFRELLTQLQRDDGGVCVFGGDTNLREAEAKAELARVSNEAVLDGWVAAGGDPAVRFTWDLALNDNKSFDGFRPRARYDRFFYSAGSVAAVPAAPKFSLLGTSRLGMGCFPSDHFGIDMSVLLHLGPRVGDNSAPQTAGAAQAGEQAASGLTGVSEAESPQRKRQRSSLPAANSKVAGASPAT